MSQSSFKKDGGEVEDESADLDTWRVSLSLIAAPTANKAATGAISEVQILASLYAFK
jgi:hypothetical protein